MLGSRPQPATSSPECARMRRATAAKATADKEASQHTIPTCTFHDCERWKSKDGVGNFFR